jgi:hypothetical protein
MESVKYTSSSFSKSYPVKSYPVAQKLSGLLSDFWVERGGNDGIATDAEMQKTLICQGLRGQLWTSLEVKWWARDGIEPPTRGFSEHPSEAPPEGTDSESET